VTPDAGAVPIACTLDAASLAERAGEWRALVASSVASVEAGATSVRLVLHESEAALAAAASIGQREKRCCTFFAVSIDIEVDRRALVLTVPAGAEEAMATFVALLTD
jgi:hypothetical protein